MDDGFEEQLEGVLISKKVDDLEGVFEQADCQLLFTILSRISDHELIDEALCDGAGNFLEASLLVLAGRVRQIDLGLVLLDGQVVGECLL